MCPVAIILGRADGHIDSTDLESLLEEEQLGCWCSGTGKRWGLGAKLEQGQGDLGHIQVVGWMVLGGG